MCHAVGATVLLVCSSTSAHATSDRDVLARDLRKLAMLAVPLRIKVAYEGLSWGRTINEFPTRGTSCAAPTRPISASASTRSTLRDQVLARRPRDAVAGQDLPRPARGLHVAGDPHGRGAHHDRAPLPRLPGEGVHSEALAELVTRLDALGYRGDYSFECSTTTTASCRCPRWPRVRGGSAVWLGEDVLAALAFPAEPDSAQGSRSRTRLSNGSYTTISWSALPESHVGMQPAPR
jgi:hypothetical protein